MGFHDGLRARHHRKGRHGLVHSNQQLPVYFNVFPNMLIDKHATPLRLAGWTALGSVVSVIGFASVRAFRESLPALLACAALALGGLVLVYYPTYQLRRGVENDRWSEEELGPLRRATEHPAWFAATFLLVIAMLASLVVVNSHRPFFWGVFVLLQPLSQLSSAVRRPPKAAGHAARLDWSKVPPLQSDHWGER